MSLLPNQYLRLARLYAQVLEDATGARPDGARAAGTPGARAPGPRVRGDRHRRRRPRRHPAGDLLSLHDQDGQPIDAVAVAAAFVALQRVHQPLQARDIDVVLTITGLPDGAAVRAYHRVFSTAADETRGDGAGGVTDAAGRVVLRLPDPLGLQRPGKPVPDPMPVDPILRRPRRREAHGRGPDLQ